MSRLTAGGAPTMPYSALLRYRMLISHLYILRSRARQQTFYGCPYGPVLSASRPTPDTVPEHPEPAPETETTTTNDQILPSSSVRQAVYAERDLHRAIDPGALDFIPDEEDTTNISPTVSSAPANGTGGRHLALKIIQARNELPDSGLWRSLAS